MKRRITTVLLLLLAFAWTPGIHAADIGGGCGDNDNVVAGSWSTNSPKSCLFNFRGLPVKVFADGRTSTGTASVHIWVDVQGYPQIRLFDCVATGSNPSTYAVCDDELGIGEQIDERWATFHLVCHVEGVASSSYPNDYYCKSATGF